MRFLTLQERKGPDVNATVNFARWSGGGGGEPREVVSCEGGGGEETNQYTHIRRKYIRSRVSTILRLFLIGALLLQDKSFLNVQDCRIART
jgi:hypothetical protein